MSQTELASLCDLEKTSISRIENGRTNVTLKTCVILSKALDVKLVDLFHMSGEQGI
jgi:DNA-binding XRE family transcriptional regulator